MEEGAGSREKGRVREKMRERQSEENMFERWMEEREIDGGKKGKRTRTMKRRTEK